jgi:hypothetical protein
MHKELKEKRERLAKMNAEKPPIPSVAATDLLNKPQLNNEDKKRENEDVKKERKVIKMVIFNGVFNFVLRAPDILFWMENGSVWLMLFPNHDSDTQQFSDHFLEYLT